jgi:hypothetical protein
MADSYQEQAMLLQPRYYAADGGGSGAEDDDPEERVRSEDVIARGTNPQDTIARLGRELDRNEDRRFKLRTERRELREKLEQAVVPADAQVLNKEQAAEYAAYTALGKKPDELKQAIDLNGEATTKLARLERAEQIRVAGDVHGYRVGLLSELRSLDGKPMETREIEEGGAKVRRTFVKDGEAELSLPDFLSKHAPDAIGALQQPPAGTGYVSQSAGDKQPPPKNAGQAYTHAQKYAIPGKTG